MKQLLIKPLSEKIGQDIPLPYYATSGAAALDLHACIDQPEVIPGGGEALIPTGLAVAIPAGHVGILAVRSSKEDKRQQCMRRVSFSAR